MSSANLAARTTWKTLGILGIALLSCAAPAQDLPESGSQSGFRRSGVVEAVDTAADVIVVDDMQFSLSANLVIHAANGQSASRGRLRPGIVIGYRQSGERLITEIWLLPVTQRQAGAQR